MNVKGKYLKNESGDIFSPITSSDTIYYNNKPLTQTLNLFNTEHLRYETLWYVGDQHTTTNKIPSKQNGGKLSITLDKPIQSGTMIFQLGKTPVIISKSQDDTAILQNDVTLTVTDYSNWGNELINFTGCLVHKVNNTQLEFSGGCLCQIRNDLSVSKTEDYNLWLVAIYGLYLD